jgi:ATP-binding cassette subfamily B (MDR/TAP) protein 1
MKDLGVAKKILGMEITRDRKSGKLYLSQRGYIEKVLRRSNMHNTKPVSTPLAAHFRLSSALCSESDKDIEYMSRVSYSSAVGSLMYAMVCSRPDLSHALSVVSRFMVNPGKEHWRAVQWIFRYCEVLVMPVCILGNLEIDLLVILILIMLVIWIRGDLLRVMFSLLVVVLLAGKQVCRLLLLCLR